MQPMPVAFFGPFSSMGPWEWALIAIVAIILFGARLPKIGRQLGQGFVEFRRGLRNVKEEISNAVEEDAQEEQAKTDSGTNQNDQNSATT